MKKLKKSGTVRGNTVVGHGNERVVLFLGAGFSAWAGYRTFMTFPGLFWPSVNEPGKLDITEKEASLLEAIRDHLSKRHLPQTLDLYLSMIHEYQSVTKSIMSDTVLRDHILTNSLEWASVQELGSQLMTIRDKICRLTALHYRAPPSNIGLDRVDEVYEFFLRAYAEYHGKLDIYTTNYDLMPEYLFADNDYFRKLRGGRLSPFSLYNFAPHFRAWDVSGDPANGPTLLNVRDECRLQQIALACAGGERHKKKGRAVLTWHRLHGCVGWLHDEAQGETVHFNFFDPDRIPGFSHRLCVSYPGHAEAYGLNPYSTSFTLLANSVYQASALVFIGFSFRDRDVIGVISQALYGRESQPRIVVVDPQLTREEIRYNTRELLAPLPGPNVDWNEIQLKTLARSFPERFLIEEVFDAVSNPR